jgi:Transposase IS116/IS110/IS902 family
MGGRASGKAGASSTPAPDDRVSSTAGARQAASRAPALARPPRRPRRRSARPHRRGSAGHFVSWAAICPGSNHSGRRRRSGKTRHGNSWLRTALTQAARAAARSKNTYLASHYWQIRGRRGDAKAIGATRHDILIAYYHIVRDRVPFRELGADWLARRYSPEHRTRRLVRQLEALGHTVTVRPPPSPVKAQPPSSAAAGGAKRMTASRIHGSPHMDRYDDPCSPPTATVSVRPPHCASTTCAGG